MPVTDKAKEELRGVVKEVFEDSLKAQEKRAEAKQQEWQKALDEQSAATKKEILDRIEKIESLPLVKKQVSIPGKTGKKEMYFGYRAEKQLLDIQTGARCGKAKELIVNPKLFPVIADAEKSEGYAKHLIMVVKAAKGDLKAKQAYEDWREKAALNEGTGSEGAYLVPEEYTDEILAFARLQSFALQDCRIWPMSSDVRRVPAENAKVSVTWKAEAAAAGESEPTFNEIVLTAKRLTAYSMASNEILMDANVDIVSYLTEIFAEATGQELDNQVLNGTGDPVSGLLTAAAGKSIIMTGLANFSSITGDNLADMIDEIPQEAEDGAKFYFHKNTLTYIRKLKDQNDQYLFGPLSNQDPGTIWGYPYTRTPKAPAKGDTGTGTAFAMFGNLRHFALGRRLESMALDIDPYGKFLEYQTRFRIVQRWAFGVGLPNAFCRLVTG